MLRKETKTRTQSPEHIPNPVSVCAIAPHLPKKENERHFMYNCQQVYTWAECQERHSLCKKPLLD